MSFYVSFYKFFFNRIVHILGLSFILSLSLTYLVSTILSASRKNIRRECYSILS